MQNYLSRRMCDKSKSDIIFETTQKRNNMHIKLIAFSRWLDFQLVDDARNNGISCVAIISIAMGGFGFRMTDDTTLRP